MWIIEPAFPREQNATTYQHIQERIRFRLGQILPADFVALQTPVVQIVPPFKSTGVYSVFFLARERTNAFKLFYELVARWLIPGKQIHIHYFSVIDFRLPELCDKMLTLGEIGIQIDSPYDLAQAVANFPVVEGELKLGLESATYARRLLEGKGLAMDDKVALIMEEITSLVQRFPKTFDLEVFAEMQHFLALSSDEFKLTHDAILLSRLIILSFLYRKTLRLRSKTQPQRRHVLVKILPKRGKSIGILIGINLSRDKEVFELRHIMQALHPLWPDVKAVKDSFFTNRWGAEPLSTLYLEIEKEAGERFTQDEISLMRNHLKKELKTHIEPVLPSIFMPRNEEEIMRNILALNAQIKFVRDLPQVFITFDEQTVNHIIFTVIMVAIVKPEMGNLQTLIENSNLDIQVDRYRQVGFIRKKYPKEAIVFHLKIGKEGFLRRDHSIDLTRARQVAVNKLADLIGEFRDYNGGMISKQSELLNKVRQLLQEEKVKVNEFLLENMFYALRPVALRTVLDPTLLKTLFQMMLAAFQKGLNPKKKSQVMAQTDKGITYISILVQDKALIQAIEKAVAKLNPNPSDLISSTIQAYDCSCIGMAYRVEAPQSHKKLLDTIQQQLG